MNENIERVIKLSHNAEAYIDPCGIVIRSAHNNDGSVSLSGQEARDLAKWIIRITPILREMQESDK